MVYRVLFFIPQLLGSLLLASSALARDIQIPLNLDYRLVEQALLSSVFVGPDQSAGYTLDPQGCNSVVIKNPGIQGGAGRLEILNDIEIKGGTPLGGSCLFPYQWRGKLKVTEMLQVLPGTATVTFKVIDATLIPLDGAQATTPTLIWENLKPLVLPQLGAVRLDLNTALNDMQIALNQMVDLPDGGSLPPLTLLQLETTRQGILGTLELALPDEMPRSDQTEAPPLTEQELAQWDANWQAWDGYATWLIKSMADVSSPELRQALADTLVDARFDLRSALEENNRQHDPVRKLFSDTWQRLAPLLKENNLEIPGAQALGFAAFISAGDALEIIDSVAPQLGLRLDSNTLRTLARLWMPAVQEDALAYTLAVDPKLRELIGLPPSFEEDEIPKNPLAWLVKSAYAANIDPLLLSKLTGWVPNATDLDSYLESMQRLLDQMIVTEKEKGKVPLEFIDVYENLVLATAWQESCWRQFEKRDGSVRPLLSSAGSVGLMQVNKNVWRGIYDPILLDSNVGYNARAGNEILVHYLVDYAIKQKEHVVSGDKHNLARATYGIYNGGPRHISRYRNADTKPALAAIDRAFWKKYQSIRNEGHGMVKTCYSP